MLFKNLIFNTTHENNHLVLSFFGIKFKLNLTNSDIIDISEIKYNNNNQIILHCEDGVTKINPKEIKGLKKMTESEEEIEESK